MDVKHTQNTNSFQPENVHATISDASIIFNAGEKPCNIDSCKCLYPPHARSDNAAPSGNETMNSAQYPEGRVEVKREDSVITVTLIGWITEALTALVQTKLEHELLQSNSACILYDGLYMNDPSLTLVFLMQSFHQRLNERIAKSAIVVPGYRLAFLSRLAFGQDESKYRVFYNDRDEALGWLKS